MSLAVLPCVTTARLGCTSLPRLSNATVPTIQNKVFSSSFRHEGPPVGYDSSNSQCSSSQKQQTHAGELTHEVVSGYLKLGPFSSPTRVSVQRSNLLLHHQNKVAHLSGAMRRPFSMCAQEISETMLYLRNHETGAEVFLVGTAHVSKKSAEEVRSVIKQVKPDTVMVELCTQRARKLMAEAAAPQTDLTLGGLLGALGNPQGGLLQVGLGLFYKLWELFGFTPGLEFKVAIQEARRIGAKVVHGDQDVNLTTRKLQAEIVKLNLADLIAMQPPAQSASVLGSQSVQSLEDYIESIKTREKAREMMQMVGKAMPGVLRVIRDERDEYMVRELLRCEGRVVGVVGIAHMDGIEALWKKRMGG